MVSLHWKVLLFSIVISAPTHALSGTVKLANGSGKTSVNVAPITSATHPL